ncbi:MAG: DUF402 domain-containing protein [Caldilineaceae bacterium]
MPIQLSNIKKTWQHGDTAVIRDIDRFDGTAVGAIPSIVIMDDPDLLVLYIPKGTPFKNNWAVSAGQHVMSLGDIVPSAQRPHRDLIWRRDNLRLYLRGYSYSVWLKFDDDNKFHSWYGNLEAPYLRTPIGIDTRDFALDVVGEPNGQWRWKDEDAFHHRLALGYESLEHQARVREAGYDFIRRFERREWPFDGGWEAWRPQKRWRPPNLPANWAEDFGSNERLSTYI